jgi:hypothetical protein
VESAEKRNVLFKVDTHLFLLFSLVLLNLFSFSPSVSFFHSCGFFSVSFFFCFFDSQQIMKFEIFLMAKLLWPVGPANKASLTLVGLEAVLFIFR